MMMLWQRALAEGCLRRGEQVLRVERLERASSLHVELMQTKSPLPTLRTWNGYTVRTVIGQRGTPPRNIEDVPGQISLKSCETSPNLTPSSAIPQNPRTSWCTRNGTCGAPSHPRPLKSSHDTFISYFACPREPCSSIILRRATNSGAKREHFQAIVRGGRCCGKICDAGAKLGWIW